MVWYYKSVIPGVRGYVLRQKEQQPYVRIHTKRSQKVISKIKGANLTLLTLEAGYLGLRYSPTSRTLYKNWTQVSLHIP